jgi:hypothetical protein
MRMAARFFNLTVSAMMGSLLSGCVGDDEVLFVTGTNIGIEADSKPPQLGISLNRIEGYIAPSYENGQLPPVLARIRYWGGSSFVVENHPKRSK